MSNPVASPLIGVDELGGLDKLDHRSKLDHRITILDVRYQLGGPSGRDEYARGHIPGAAYVDLDQDLADPPGAGGRHPLPEQGRFEAAMRRAGVSTDRPVVVYDDWAGRAAARAWWLLRYYGHEDVRVLDGGWSAWTGEVETGSPTVATGDFHGTPGQLKVLEAEDVLAFAAANVLIDARNPSATAGRSNRSTRSPATSPARSTSRLASTWPPTAGSGHPRSSGPSMPRRPVRWRRTAGRA
ncbi:MAG: sseA [Marmoricola sp.]|nr:sseA [Marmoricola sp.]